MDQIKEAFSKVKQDISDIQNEVGVLRKELTGTRDGIISLCDIIKGLQISQEKISSNLENFLKKYEEQLNQTIPTQNQLNQTIPTYIPTQMISVGNFNKENKQFSTGNGGVPTDRQTDRQTDKSEENNIKIEKNTVNNAIRALDSLDIIKKEIRSKFKRLTNQEMLIFTTLYQIEEERGTPDYKTLAKRLNLTESSVRDYIGKLIKKEIPIEKNKINNKTILLSILDNFKKIVPLSTILTLRKM